MSSASTAPSRLANWLAAEDDGNAVALYRRVFAALWVVYDVVDLIWGMTERSRIWFPHERDLGLLALQALLVVSGAMLVLGRHVWLAGTIAAVARAAEALEYFALNDFFFVSVVSLLLAHSDGGPFSRGRRARWVHDALLFQFAWIYVTTGVLKLNPDWLGGGQLFVRTQYLWHGHDWPYPGFVERALSSLRVDARLAAIGATSEIALGCVVFARQPYWLAAALVIGIHTFGAFVTNVWFFSASMAAGILILMPHAYDGATARGA